MSGAIKANALGLGQSIVDRIMQQTPDATRGDTYILGITLNEDDFDSPDESVRSRAWESLQRKIEFETGHITDRPDYNGERVVVRVEQ